jgi:5'-nucleotidase
MRTVRLLPAIFFAAACGSSSNNNPDMSGNPDMSLGVRSLILLHTNDEHSHLFGDTPELDDFPPPTAAGSGAILGGVSRRAVLLQKERDAAKAAGADTLTVSAGDNSMGSLFQVAFPRTGPDYQMMKALGYDVTTLGNHEMDFGPDGLASAISAAKGSSGLPVIVASNIQFPNDPKVANLQALFDESGTDMTKPVHRTWIVTTPNGLKVGFIGAVGADAAYSAPNKAPITFSLPAGAKETDYATVEAQAWKDLQAASDKLHAGGANVVVVLSHSGVDLTDYTKGEDYLIAKNVTGVDVIVSGHTHVISPIQMVMNTTSNKPVWIQQADHFGYALGKIVLSVDATGKVSADMSASKVITIDDTTVPSDATINTLVSTTMADIEGTKLTGGTQSFAEQTLSEIMGSAVTNSGTAGNLFFKTVGTTAFDLAGFVHLKETPFSVLIADAEMYAGDKYAPAGKTNDVAVIATGALRSDLKKGKTGNIAFADLFATVPLGLSTVNGTIGYPLCRFGVYPIELKAALELTTSYAYTTSDSFYMITSGIKYEYDTTRPPFDFSGNPTDPANGRIIKMWLNTDHTMPGTFSATPVFDATNAANAGNFGWASTVNPAGDIYKIISTAYIASYAGSQGVTLKDPDTGATPFTLQQAILHRTDGSEIKDWEALGQFLQKSGAVPALYNSTTAQRAICDGPLCVK